VVRSTKKVKKTIMLAVAWLLPQSVKAEVTDFGISQGLAWIVDVFGFALLDLTQNLFTVVKLMIIAVAFLVIWRIKKKKG